MLHCILQIVCEGTSEEQEESKQMEGWEVGSLDRPKVCLS